MDGMLYAAIAHPPVLGGTVKSLDDKPALAVKGVRQTITIETFKPPCVFQPLGGVAVLADNTWAAFQGRKQLKIEWDNGPNASYNSDEFKRQLQDTARKPGKVWRNQGDVDKEFASGRRSSRPTTTSRTWPTLPWNLRWPWPTFAAIASKSGPAPKIRKRCRSRSRRN